MGIKLQVTYYISNERAKPCPGFTLEPCPLINATLFYKLIQLLNEKWFEIQVNPIINSGENTYYSSILCSMVNAEVVSMKTSAEMGTGALYIFLYTLHSMFFQVRISHAKTVNDQWIGEGFFNDD